MNSYSVNSKLVTIYCLLYNHEKYVRESVSSILNQSYSDLQIIISDDCSTDRTYEIAEELVNNYEGCHEVILRKNLKNLGLIKHVEKCLALSKGHWIFQAAGDDISQLTRVSDTMNYIEDLHIEVAGVFTNLIVIDNHGDEKGLYFNALPNCAKNLKDYQDGLSCWAIGASLCFNRILYDKYGNFVKNVMGEDGCLAFRAILEGGIEYFHLPTVCYRMHDNNLSQNLTLKQKINFKKKELWLYINHLKDSELNENSQRVRGKIKMKILKSLIVDWLLGKSIARILHLFYN